jgi:hypothetical protein
MSTLRSLASLESASQLLEETALAVISIFVCAIVVEALRVDNISTEY